MKCDRCGEGKETGHPYEFYYGTVTDPQRMKSNHPMIKEYSQQIFVDGKVDGWICNECLVKMALNDPMMIILIIFNIGMWIAGIIFGGFFAAFLGGLVMTPVFIVLMEYVSLDTFFLKTFVDQQGIRLHKKITKDHNAWTRSQHRKLGQE